MKPPFFSVLVLCWNSDAYIHKCLDSLQSQIFEDFEVICVDNGSTEPLAIDALACFSKMEIRNFRLEQNVGFAAGNNFAARQARGQYLVLLNSDAFPQPNWLQEIFKAIQRYPQHSFASRLVMANAPSVLDGEGDNYHATGIAWRKSFGHPVNHSANQERAVFSACGAAAVYPKQAYERLHGFDEDYFAYSEDVDLGFRLRLIGIPCVYLPSAVVYHVGSGSTSQRSDFSVYYGQRNLVWTFFKNMPGALLVILLPAHLVMNLGMILLSVFRRQGGVAYRAKRDAFVGLGKFLKKRRAIQMQRRISISSLVKVIDWNPLSPLTKLLVK